MTRPRTDQPALAVGQTWAPAEPSARRAVVVTDLTPTGAVHFVHVLTGNRDRLSSRDFVRAFPRHVASPRPQAPPTTAEAVPDDF